MKDIARELGISVATVSRALKNSPHISKSRREQIIAYAHEHKFFPNPIAAQLRQSHTTPVKTIGVIIPQFVHHYFSSVLSGIEQVASEAGYRIMVAQSGESYDREVEICNSFYHNKVCGIIVSQAKNTTQYDHFEQLQAAGVPLVFYDRICPGINANRVVSDDYMAAFTAVSHLVETGCKRIAIYGSNANMEIARNRLNGFKDAIFHHGMKVDESLIFNCDNREQAEHITPNVLATENRPDAFFAINDDTAVGILSIVKKAGFKIPDDISICGFTNNSFATVCDPPLTTVDQHGVKIGQESAKIIIDIAEGRISPEKVTKRVVKTDLIVRGTTR